MPLSLFLFIVLLCNCDYSIISWCNFLHYFWSVLSLKCFSLNGFVITGLSDCYKTLLWLSQRPCEFVPKLCHHRSSTGPSISTQCTLSPALSYQSRQVSDIWRGRRNYYCKFVCVKWKWVAIRCGESMLALPKYIFMF